ncbi:MAG: zinc-dependent metalloprotease [Actinomycetota bacterium]|nr:zinc-dependent metalloprotease [Actinomycetota bacterium]
MTDPFSGGFDPRMFENVPLFRELAKVMSWSGGPVNWEIATQTAMAVAGQGARDSRGGSGGQIGPGGERATEELATAVRTGELWLDEVTGLPHVDGRARALSLEEWVRLACASPGLGVYVEPVAEGMREALGRQLPEQLAGMGGGQGAAGGPLGQALDSLGAMMYGVQLGTVAGHLAGQLLGTYDLGLPTLEPRVVGTVGDTAWRFADEYGFDQTELRHWLALRESAHRRQFAGVPWLREHVAGLIRGFAADADFDPGGLMERLGGMGMGGELADPDALREALEGPDAFRVEPTAAQRATLARLQAVVAFTESWVDTVVRTAGTGKLTALPRIEEAVRRRRTEPGPGERMLQQLIGLDLKPADVRVGQRFCDAVIAARGQEGLDRAWEAPANLPTPAELSEPSRWLVRMAAAELDAQLGPADDAE